MIKRIIAYVEDLPLMYRCILAMTLGYGMVTAIVAVVF
jgi:hypothetical protein